MRVASVGVERDGRAKADNRLINVSLCFESVAEPYVPACRFRIKLDELFMAGDGLVHSPVFVQGTPQTVKSRGVFRVKLERLSVAGDGFIQFLLCPQDIASGRPAFRVFP